MANTQQEQADHGTAQPKKRVAFSKEFIQKINAAGLPPGDVVVAGDGSPIGQSLRGTYLDDGRAGLPWTDEHEGIVTGLLTGSAVKPLKQPRQGPDGEWVCELDPETGAPLSNDAGDPVLKMFSFEVGVTEGAPCLVFLQGAVDERGRGEWYPLMQDGRQRKRAAEELQRRLDFCAALCNAAVPPDRAGKVARRNCLIKVGGAATRGTARDAIPEKLGLIDPGTDAHRATLAVLEGWDSPNVGRSLLWLTDTFAHMVVGSDQLGDHLRAGWLVHVRDAAGKATDAVAARAVWLRVLVSGCNVDPQDPRSLLDAAAAKESQVETPPSLFAQNMVRFLTAPLDPAKPDGARLYTRAAVLAKLGKSDTTAKNYELVAQLVPEVQALLDSGEMSINFAVAQRESAFASWPSKGPRKGVHEVLPPDKQRLVLSHLLAEAEQAPDGERLRFSGPAAMKLGRKLRDAALDGELLPVGSESVPLEGTADDGDEAAPAALGVQNGVPKPTAPAAPKKRARATLDMAQYREALDRARAENDGRRNEALLSGQEDGTERFYAVDNTLALARALGLVLAGLEPPEMLDAWPEVQAAVVAALPQEAAAPQPSEGDLILDWISVEAGEFCARGLDLPHVSTSTDSHGRRPTEEQAQRCNGLISQWVDEFEAQPSDGGINLLDEFLITKIAQAQTAGA